MDAMLVIAPPSAFEAWIEEADESFSSELKPRVSVCPEILVRTDTVVVLNYEKLSDAAVRAGLARWIRNRRVLTVFDEAHRAKAGERSQRGAEAAALARRSYPSMVLTGTPMPNRIADLKAVFDLVWPGQGHRLVDGDLAHLRNRAYVRATKKDLDLPPLDVRIERIALDPPHRALYDAMAARIGKWAGNVVLDGAEAQAAEAGRALMHLLAAATNPAAVFTPDEPWALPKERSEFPDLREVIDSPSRHIRPAKIVRAAHLVADNRKQGRKTVVWSAFVGNVAALAQGLAHHNPAVITGATVTDNPMAPTDRRRQLDKFREDTDCWVLIATPQTLGEGVSLHHTSIDQVHVDRGYAAGTWLQSIDRTHRLGLPATAHPTCTILVAEDTVDERVSEVLNAKVRAMGVILDDPSLRPVADPMVTPGDPAAAVLGDIDALGELLHRLC
ncbi:hypothetical protein ILP97_00500 [Amycolatopsis sp. H6(2020)]|nr:hypothetical protein [Amycolatopsis sp. H6(2020)]